MEPSIPLPIATIPLYLSTPIAHVFYSNEDIQEAMNSLDVPRTNFMIVHILSQEASSLYSTNILLRLRISFLVEKWIGSFWGAKWGENFTNLAPNFPFL
jgi:hypothetical protein